MDGWNMVRTIISIWWSLTLTLRMDGIELVTLIKKDANLKALPVMIALNTGEDRRRGLERARTTTHKGSHDETLQWWTDWRSRVKIGIVNDLPMAAEALRRAIALKPEYQVSWIARDGAEAVAMCAQQTPDLVLMDLIMPGMNGVEATRRIMTETPCAILVVTANVGRHATGVLPWSRR
jgi:CheY-like chemotaxis protein